jgi:hypothetical protein
MQGLPRVALEIGAELPDLSQIADVVDLTPTFRLRAGGSLMEASVSLFAEYGDTEMAVRADGITLPILIRPPEEGSRRARCVRLDIAAQQEAANRLGELGLAPDQTGQAFRATGDSAIQFWTEGLGALPDTWDLFVPEELVDTQVRRKPIGAFARVSSGMDWLSVKVSFESEGVAVDRDELRRCLTEGRRTCASPTARSRPSTPRPCAPCSIARSSCSPRPASSGKIPLAQAGRVQELLQQAHGAQVSASARAVPALSNIDEIEATKKPRPQGDASPVPRGGALLAQVRPRHRLGRRPRRRHGSRQDGADHRPSARHQAGGQEGQSAHRRAHLASSPTGSASSRASPRPSPSPSGTAPIVANKQKSSKRPRSSSRATRCCAATRSSSRPSSSTTRSSTRPSTSRTR